MTRSDQAAARRFLRSDVLDTAFARIRGLESEDRVQAWLDVEADLGPRQPVVRALNRRREELRALPEDWPQEIDRDTPNLEWTWTGPEGETRPFDERPTSVRTGGAGGALA